MKARKPSKARQRIVETAERLFYREGIRSVGIDRIIAEAKVAKMTLYNHFASKDALILAVLRYRENQFQRGLENNITKHRQEGLNAFDAFFAALHDWFESPGFRGCSFINAAIELADANHPAARFAAQHKEQFHAWLIKLLTDNGGTKAESLAPAIALLVEGAIVTAQVEGRSDCAEIARQSAKKLLQC